MGAEGALAGCTMLTGSMRGLTMESKGIYELVEGNPVCGVRLRGAQSICFNHPMPVVSQACNCSGRA